MGRYNSGEIGTRSRGSAWRWGGGNKSAEK